MDVQLLLYMKVTSVNWTLWEKIMSLKWSADWWPDIFDKQYCYAHRCRTAVKEVERGQTRTFSQWKIVS